MDIFCYVNKHCVILTIENKIGGHLKNSFVFFYLLGCGQVTFVLMVNNKANIASCLNSFIFFVAVSHLSDSLPSQNFQFHTIGSDTKLKACRD